VSALPTSGLSERHAPPGRRADLAEGMLPAIALRYVPRMSSESYHEPLELLSEHTKNLHRANVSLREELEAVDWYQQRAEACSDPELKAVLTHNKNEEIEHAMMTLEWLRRNDATVAANIATYIGAAGPIVGVEAAATGSEGAAAGDAPKAGGAASRSLGIGSLKGMK
jgi:uncharacterized protein